MKSLLEHRALKHLDVISDLLESTDPGDAEHELLYNEKEALEIGLTNEHVDLKEQMQKTNMLTGLSERAGQYISAQRVTRVYFAEPNEVQAQAFGLKKDGQEWYMNVWHDNVKVTNIHDYLNGKGIPFKMSKFNAYGGRKA